MIKATEIMINEDGDVGVSEHCWPTVDSLCQYDYFSMLMSNGSVVVGDVEYKDNFGEDLPQDVVDEFKRRIYGKKGVFYTWSVEYDVSYWFIEIDKEHIADLLTIDHYDCGDDTINCTQLREIARMACQVDEDKSTS